MNNRPIDEKIVKMTLDNAGFEKNVKETVGSLNSINDSVAQAGNIDMRSLNKAANGIQSRFSATGVVVASVINDIVKRTIDMGVNLTRALVDPLTEGGKKRALNIEQAKFQFEGLGMDVEATMASALEAVKGTAFGLDEAAVIAAQFGATGMRAGDEMTEALRGISGVAAMTGSSYSDVGQIFATVAGNGRLMGNDLLRLGARGVNAAATLGKALGKSEQEVRKMVTAGKIDFDTFAGAMSDAFGEHATKANETYTGSLSNLRAALSRIGAEVYTPRFEKMRDIFNTMTPVVDDLADALGPVIEMINNLTIKGADNIIKTIERIDFKKFSDLGGMSNIVSGFMDLVATATDIFGAFSQGFRNVFPGSFMNTLITITETFRGLANNLRMSSGTIRKLTTIFQGVFSVIQAVTTIAWQLGSAILGLVPTNASGSILDFITRLAEMAIAFNKSVQEGNFLTDVIKGLAGYMKSIGQAIGSVINGTISLAKAIGSKLGPILEWFKALISPITGALSEMFGDSTLSAENILGGGVLFGIVVVAQKIYDLFLKVSFLLEGLSFNIAQTFRRLGTALGKFIGDIKYNSLMKIAISIGILAVSLKLLESMNLVDIAEGLIGLVGAWSILGMGMKAIENLEFVGGIRASITILSMAIAMTIMASAMKKIADLDPREIGLGIGGLIGMMTALTLGMLALSKIKGEIQVGALQLIGLAVSIVIITSALEKLSEIETSSLVKSILALGAIFLAIAGFLALTNKAKIGPGTAIGLIGIATSMIIMSKGIDMIGSIDTEKLKKGLITIGGLLLAISIFSVIAGEGKMISAGVGITGIAIALNLIMIPLNKLSGMSWEEIAKGLAGIAGALGIMTLFGSLASGTILGAVGITLLAGALTLLIAPMAFFSALSWQQLLMGLVGLAGTLTTLAVVSMLLTPAIAPMLGFAAGILAIGAAVALVGLGISLFGTGLAALAGLTAGSVVAIIGSLNMLIKGLSDLVTNIVKFVVNLGVALIDGIITLVPKVVDGIAVLISALLKTLSEHIPDFIEYGYTIIMALMDGIEEKGPELQMRAGETMVTMVEGMADSISANRTPLINAFVRLMGEVILVVIEAGTATIEALFGWIPGVEGAMEKVTNTAEDYIVEHFGAAEVAEEKGKEFADGLESSAPLVGTSSYLISKHGMDSAASVDYTETGSDLGGQLNTGLLGWKPTMNDTGVDVAMSSLEGAESVDLTNSGIIMGEQLNTGLNFNLDKSFTSGYDLSDNVKDGAESVNLKNTGQELGNELKYGIDSKQGTVKTAGRDAANKGKEGAESVSMHSSGANFATGFANGIGSTNWFVEQKARSIASRASSAVNSYLLMRSPSRLMFKAGRFFTEGFGNGIGDRVRSVASKAKDLAIRASNAVQDNLGSLIPDEHDLTINVEMDDLNIDRPEPIEVGFRPDTSFSKMMANSAGLEFRQNGNNHNMETKKEPVEHHEHNYHIGVTAGGNMSKAEVKRLAKDIQTEIKNTNDRDRMGRGEAVIF